MSLSIPTYIVDSFTNKVFKGNPAGVCILNEEIDESAMLNIAKELGHSETAFISNVRDSNTYNIRFFSPKMEIPLCGHATLASSQVLFSRLPALNHIHFVTIEKIDLLAHRDEESIIMEFPIYDTIPAQASKALLDALNIVEIINCEYNKETNILLLEIENCAELQALKPDFNSLVKSHDSINGVLITSKSDKANFDFESRYFWPWSGTNEDPVTGGTHTFLAKYWYERLNKKKMNSFQCSERSGFMEVELINDKKLNIKSSAKIVFIGNFIL